MEHSRKTNIYMMELHLKLPILTISYVPLLTPNCRSWKANEWIPSIFYFATTIQIIYLRFIVYIGTQYYYRIW